MDVRVRKQVDTPRPERRAIHWWLPVLAVVALVIVAVLDIGDAPPPPVPNATAAYHPIPRPYGDAAPWNIPVSQVIDRLGSDALDPDGEEYVRILWNESLAERGLNLGLEDYTYPVYFAEDAAGVFPVDAAGNLDEIPWNPQWRAAPGRDGQVIVLAVVKARRANLVMVSVGTGTEDGHPVIEPTDEPADYRTYEGGFPPSRGVGIQYLAMLVRPEEIRAGVIAHALSMPIPEPSGETFVAPATKLEFPDHDRGIPEGTRFFLDVTDAELDDWIDQLPDELSSDTIRSARIVAVALRDYGFIVTDTAGAAFLQFEAMVSAGDEWERIGFGDQRIDRLRYPRDLLDGLVTADRLRVLVPSDAYGD
jgi:hypothetical protein